jgi:type III secretory pathway lipoprotein EscJ
MITAQRRRWCAGGFAAAACVALLGSYAPSASAQPESSPWLGRRNPLRAFVPSAEARAAEQKAHAEALLERRLALLPGVRAAHVRLVLPALDQTPLDRPSAAARAHVLLRAGDPSEPSREDVARLISDALPELGPVELALTRAPSARPAAAAPPPNVRVGPFWVAVESALPLRAALAGCLLSNVVLAGLLLVRKPRRS